MASSASPQGQPVELSSLTIQQLSQVKKQLDDELEHLTTSFQKLKGAQAKFRECLKTIGAGVSEAVMGKPLLVPLTTSLYVPGKLADPEHVIVDIGTGFYVEKTTKEAEVFYNAKIEDLEKNLKDLESIVQGKSNNLQVVEEVLRQKVISSQQSSGS